MGLKDVRYLLVLKKREVLVDTTLVLIYIISLARMTFGEEGVALLY